MLNVAYPLYGRPDLFATACSFMYHCQPHVRQEAVAVLAALGSSSSSSKHADAVFQQLCVVVATDTLAQLRLQALQGLAGLHHASTAIKMQALSKKATLRLVVQPGAASQTASAAGGGQQPPTKKQKHQPQHDQPLGAHAGLLDAATGALVHGTEDDIPRVRLAAVAAIVSLSSHDAVFAEAAAALLSDLVGDQLLEVRQAALQALLPMATAFHSQWLLTQQQRQSAQQPQEEGQSDMAGISAAEAADTDMDGAGAEAQQETLQRAADLSAAGLPQGVQPAAPQPLEAAAGALQQQQQQGARTLKAHKSDLPTWGKDALLAAVSALADREHSVRHLGLQLLQLLPPRTVPDLVTVIKGITSCCERFPQQHTADVTAVVDQLISRRAEMVTLAAGKLVPHLASMLPTTAGTAAAAPGALSNMAGSTAASHAAAGAVAASGLSPGAQVLTALLLSGVQQRRQGLHALLKDLRKSGLLELPVLQPWLEQVQALKQQQQQQQQE